MNVIIKVGSVLVLAGCVGFFLLRARDSRATEPVKQPVPSPEETAILFESDFDAQRGLRELEFARETITTRATTMNVPGVKLGNVECRRTLCKVTVSFANEEADHRFFSKVFLDYDGSTEAGRRFGAMGVKITERRAERDGSTTATVYVFTRDANPALARVARVVE